MGIPTHMVTRQVWNIAQNVSLGPPNTILAFLSAEMPLGPLMRLTSNMALSLLVFGALQPPVVFAKQRQDYEGQARAEYYSRSIITIFGIIGFIFGYYCQQLSYTVYTLGLGFLIASTITLPPWPIYRRKPLKWQKPKAKQITETTDQSENKLKKKK